MLLMFYVKSGELNNPIGCSLTVFLFYLIIDMLIRLLSRTKLHHDTVVSWYHDTVVS